MIQNEPIPDVRTVPLFIVDAAGAGIGGVVFVAGDSKLRKHGGSWVNTTNLPVESTGGAAGSYTLQLAQAETDTVGELAYQITKASIKTFVDAVTVEPVDAQRYFLAQAGSASGITLDAAASATNDLYASATSPAIVLIVRGTGAGQARKANGYNGTTKVLSVTPNWVTNPDVTSVAKILPETEAGSASTAAIASAVWTYIIEAGITAEQFARLWTAVLVGEASSLEGATPTYRDFADTKNRVVATYSAGLRTPTTRDGT